MRHVCVVRHALALDEKRVKFLPEFVNGGSGPLDDEGNVKEVWFPGSHSDMYVAVKGFMMLWRFQTDESTYKWRRKCTQPRSQQVRTTVAVDGKRGNGTWPPYGGCSR